METQTNNYDLVIVEAVIASIERQGSFEHAFREVGLKSAADDDKEVPRGKE